MVTAQNQMENGVCVWTFNGQLLYRFMRDRFFQLTWRPRPPSLLTEEQQKEISRNLRK
jgi:translation initiation factor 3 subunit B